ncbi:MAG: cytochrome c [Rhodothermales bacterium]
MNVIVLLAVVAVLVALRFVPRMNILAWIVSLWAGAYVVFRWGIDPPLPSSILNMFMAILTLALLAYMSADSDHFRFVRERVVRFLTEKRYTVPLIVVLLLLPGLVALRVYLDMTAAPVPPVSSRTIHPPPPTSIDFKGETIDLVADENPYRSLETEDPEQFARHVANGRRVYFENCVFCHGDDMGGDGLFAHGFNPIPANFRSSTTIAMLQETYIFWRIAKGAPGLPSESTPWKSAMPAWEDFLTEEEIWDVTLFLYDYTGQRPRAREHVE